MWVGVALLVPALAWAMRPDFQGVELGVGNQRDLQEALHSAGFSAFACAKVDAATTVRCTASKGSFAGVSVDATAVLMEDRLERLQLDFQAEGYPRILNALNGRFGRPAVIKGPSLAESAADAAQASVVTWNMGAAVVELHRHGPDPRRGIVVFSTMKGRARLESPGGQADARPRRDP
jgi:hypothetical protein